MARSPDDIADATFRLVLTPGLGPVTHEKLRTLFGDDEAIVNAAIVDLMQVEGIGRATAEALRRGIDEADVAAERNAMREHDVKLILREDDDYPRLLAAIDDPSPALWIRGQVGAEAEVGLAIVGSRRCTAYGREQAGRLAALLAQCGLTIVSGGALGVDAEAHRGALRVGGRTIAVLGNGLSRCYPPEHEALFDRITAEGGALLSELPMSAEPLAHHFPRRNRIISGLSLGVLVVEAARRSGALITARLAAEDHHRVVMALPGRVDSPASIGCLELIRDGGAALVLNHGDVIAQLDGAQHLLRGARDLAPPPHEDGEDASLLERAVTDEQRRIVDALRGRDGPVQADQIAARTQLSVSRILAEMTILEIRGLVAKHAQGYRLSRRVRAR